MTLHREVTGTGRGTLPESPPGRFWVVREWSDTLPDLENWYYVWRSARGSRSVTWLSGDGKTPRRDYFGKPWTLGLDDPHTQAVIAAAENGSEEETAS